MSVHRRKVWAHRIVGWDGDGPGLAGAYGRCCGDRCSGLALFYGRVEAETEARRINSTEEMDDVEVVEVEVTILIKEQA
jgi:hypothetical protein